MGERDTGAEVQLEDGSWRRLSEVLNADPANSPKVLAAMQELQLDTAAARRDYMRERLESVDAETVEYIGLSPEAAMRKLLEEAEEAGQ